VDFMCVLEIRQPYLYIVMRSDFVWPQWRLFFLQFFVVSFDVVVRGYVCACVRECACVRVYVCVCVCVCVC